MISGTPFCPAVDGLEVKNVGAEVVGAVPEGAVELEGPVAPGACRISK